jgi:WD40 repeat protein
VANGQQVRQLAPARPGQRLGGRSLFGVAGAVPASSLAFTHDGKLLAAAGPGGALTFWDGVSGTEVMPGHKGPLTGVVFAPNGKILYSLGEDGTVRQWDLAAGRQLQSILLPADAHGVALAPDGRAVAFRTDAKALAVWDLAAGTTRAQVPDLERSKTGCPGCDPPGGLRLSADGKLLARIGADGTVAVWDIPGGRNRWTLHDAARAGPAPLFGQSLQDLVFAPDGRRLAALQGGPSRKDPPVASVFLWDTSRGKLVRQLDGLQGLSGLVVLAPDGRTLATAGQDGTAAVWEIATGKERIRLRTGVAGPLTALAYSPDSAMIVAAGPAQTLWCWDALTGQRLGQRRDDQADVDVLAFAPDGRTLVSGGRDGTLLLWHVASFHQEKRPPAPKLEPAEERQCWDDLASTDAARAARALTRLQAAPLEAVALVRRQVQPVAAIDPKKLERLIKDLDSADFSLRQQATVELAKLGYLAEPSLRTALKNRPSVEASRRIEGLLDKLPTEEPASGQELRELRAVELLERLALPAADALLHGLSAGAGGARLTREARAAVERRRSRAGR